MVIALPVCMAYITIKAIVPQKVADAVRGGRIHVRDRSRELSDHLKDDYSQLFLQAGAVDIQPADNGATRTQEQWIAEYNKQEGDKKGKRMIASYDVLGVTRHSPKETLESMRNDCRSYWLVTSTHPSYNRRDLSGRVIHNYNSTIVKPTVISLDEIPELNAVPLPEVLKMLSGLLYVRAWANNPHATKKALLKAFEDFGENDTKDILFYTPDQSSRASYPERAAGFDFGNDRFRVDGIDGADDYDGRSRGVSVKSAKPTRKNKR